MRSPRTPAHRSARFRRLALAALVLCVAGATADDIGGGPDRAAPWAKVGEPVPIAVVNGRARFTVPTVARADKTLLVISSLARGPRLHDVRLTAQAATQWAPAARAQEGRHRPPEIPASRPIPVPPRAIQRPPAERSFHLMVRQGDPTSASNYLAVRGLLCGVGERVQVYVDARATEAVDQDLLRDIVTTFDTKVFPEAVRRWGPARDVDRDGRFTVLLSDWLSRFGGGRLAVDGFVRGADLDMRLNAPFSNHCDMMYLSTSLRAGPHLRTVLAHEYAHATTFSHKAGLDGNPSRTGRPEEEAWLDEAIAHLVEDAHQFSRSNLDYRVSAFLSQPERYQLVVKDYYAADLFRSHGNRGSTYLFLRWCVNQFGQNLLTNLIRSPRHGVENLEAATGMPFADLYRRWSTDLYLDAVGINTPETTRGTSDERPTREPWATAGPRPHVQHLDAPPQSWSMTGTSSHYAIVDGSDTGAVLIDIVTDPGAELQVTAVRLPSDLPSLELAIHPMARSPEASRVRLMARAHEGAGVQLTRVSWEPLVPRSDISDGANRHGSMDGGPLKDAFTTLSLGNESPHWSAPISLTGLQREDEPIVIKLLGVDHQGRRIVAWALYPPAEEQAAGLSGEGQASSSVP